ncbi:MAG: ribonuclease H-like domain-containing protein [Patescibacteria group bacterium]
MNRIIFDIETKNFFDTVHSTNPADLDISVVCLYESTTDTYHSFTEDQFDEMWDFFRRADTIVTYNGNHFDIPCLQAIAPIDLSHIHHIDIFEDVYKASGKKLGLDAIAQATLGIAKSGHGSDAIAWWNAGEVQKIIDYCLQDVRVTKEVFDYAEAHKKLYFEDKISRKKIEIAIDTTHWIPQEDNPAQGGLF